MAESSMDAVCKVDRQELANALDQARKEVGTRFDFKGAHIEIKLEENHITLEAPDQMKMKQLIDVVQSKIARREINLKAFQFGDFESNVSGIQKCRVTIQSGLTQDQIKKSTKLIKDSKMKVQSRIQGDAVRITGKSKDDLQAVQTMIRNAGFEFHVAFDNYR
ncbi:MAG: YajQ family cyclic di-GMP-binding protein [Leptospiraceae bacterium]|nr:YajQ family cyclic di-GMP-binding protein [Leptospiraceae bacterium]